MLQRSYTRVRSPGLRLTPYIARAAEGNYEAMVLACIDPRMQEPVHRYTVEQNLTAYGEASIATPQAETQTHRAALAEFRKQVGERHPQLGVETGLMALDGKMEMFS
jgi:hypothetical protein